MQHCKQCSGRNEADLVHLVGDVEPLLVVVIPVFQQRCSQDNPQALHDEDCEPPKGVLVPDGQVADPWKARPNRKLESDIREDKQDLRTRTDRGIPW